LIFGIQVDSKDSKRLLAWTTGGAFLSTDAGESWKHLMPPEGSPLEARATLIGSRIYCWCKGTVYASDDGKAWEKTPLQSSRILHVTCQPGKPEVVWLLHAVSWGGATQRLCASRWERANKHVREYYITDVPEGQWYYLIVSPVDPKVVRVFVMQYNPTSKTLVYGSNDGGKTWDHWTLDFLLFSHTFSTADSKTIYACAQKQPGKLSGFLQSKDGGKTWKQVSANEKISSMRTIMFYPKTGHVYLGTIDKGLFKSTDFGKTLTELNAGLYNKNISALAADPNDENVLYAGTQCGLYKSTDGGKNWKWASKGLAACQSTGLLTFPGDPERIILLEYHQGLRVSSDGGKMWSPCGEHDVLKGKPYQAWVIGDKAALHLSTTKGYELFISEDRGDSWRILTKTDASGYLVAVISEKEIYGARRGGYLTKCTDGKEWKILTKPFLESKEVILRVLAPAGKDCILVVGEKEMVRCDPSSGKRLGTVTVPPDVQGIPGAAVVCPSDSRLLYFMSAKGKIFRYNLDDGEWTCLYSHSDDDKVFRYGQLAFDPGNKKRIIAAYSNGKIVLSNDAGENWQQLKPELPFFDIRHVAVTSNRKLVIAGNGTVYTLDLSKVK
jgi:photosystem II stability/assembly factor-like uncharacterized protein